MEKKQCLVFRETPDPLQDVCSDGILMLLPGTIILLLSKQIQFYLLVKRNTSRQAWSVDALGLASRAC